jgi:hypothetical protein
MLAYLQRLPLTLDPLIAEAKRRMRRRRVSLTVALLSLAGVATAVGLISTHSPAGKSTSRLAANGQNAGTPGTVPRGVVESCGTQSSASFPDAFTSRRNLALGPLALIDAGGTPQFVWDSTGTEGFQKFALLVRAKHRVTLELSRRTRQGAGLAYGPQQGGEVHLRDTHRVVTFIACKSGRWSGSRADGRPVTFWSGGVLARSPRCVPILVWIDRRPAPRRLVIHLGVTNCR